MKIKSTLHLLAFLFSCAFALGAAAEANAQELITNGDFSSGLTGWVPSTFGQPGGSSGTNANGPTSTAAASGNYAYAGGALYNLLTQDVNLTTGSAYRLTFLAGSKSGDGSTYGILSLRQYALTNYNAASFDYRPSDAAFGSYTVDFVADTTTIGVWLRNDYYFPINPALAGAAFAAYDNVSLTPIASVANAMNYSSASGFTEITSVLTGSGRVTSSAGTGGLTLTNANTYTGGTEVTGGRLFVAGAGTLGAAAGSVIVSGSGRLDLRNQQVRTGTISMVGENASIVSGEPSTPGSIVNNGVAFQFGGGLLSAPVSGSAGFNVTGGGLITGSNSYAGPTTISATPGWFGTNTLYVDNAHALGAASADLTISGGIVSLQNNTVTRSGSVTISGGSVHTGTLSKSSGVYDIQGGSISATLDGAAGLTKSGAGPAGLSGSNSYSGATTVNGGELYASHANALGDAAAAITVNSGTLYINANMTRTGTVTVNGADLGTTNGSTLTNNGGGFVLAGSYASPGGVVLAGSSGLTSSATDARIWAQATYSGSTAVTAGTLMIGGVGGIPTASAVSIASGAAINLTGFFAPNNINRTIGGLSGSGVLYGDGGTVTVNKTAGTDTFGGDIQGGQGLIKDGAGTLILAGNSSYSGATAVNAGGLLVNGANSGSGLVTVASGARFGGDGSLAGGLAMAVQAQFIFNPLATLDVTGAVTLDESFGVASLVSADGSAIDWGSIADNTYTLINTTSTFDNITNFGPGNAFDIGGGRSAYFQNGSLQLVVVPEPGAFALAGLGIAAAWALRRRR